jgi:hypothetical protein
MAQFNYTADYNDQYSGFEALPAGIYRVQIIDSDIQVPSSGDGEMLMLEYEIVASPQFDGRRIKEWLKFRGSGDVKWAIQKINTIFFLTGLKNTKDTAQLHGKSLSLLLGVKPSGNDKNGIFRESSNFVKKYLPFNSDGDSENNQAEQEETGTKKPKFVK